MTAIAAMAYSIEEIPNVHLTDKTQYVSNPDGVLRQATVDSLNRSIAHIWQSSSAEVVAVVVNSIDGNDIDDYATALFRHWGIGKKDNNNGVLMLVSTEERKAVIRNGYGAEGILPDIICGRIIRDNMVPHFREGDYDRGMVRGVEAVAAVLAGSELETGVPDAVPQEDDTPWWVIALIVGGCVAVPLVAVVRMLRCPRCKRWFALRSQGERIVLRAEGWRMVEQTLVCRRCGETIRRRRREADGSDIGGRGGGMWIGGRGLFGGGFGGGHAGGGFGGGSFGGGGAGSKW